MNDGANLPPASGGHDDSLAHSSPQFQASRGDSAGRAKAPERRKRRRAVISAPVRVRGAFRRSEPDEVSTTLDVSRNGFLFASAQKGFSRGMVVAVTFPYSQSPVAAQAEQPGRVVRVTEMPDGRYAVAVALGLASRNETVGTSGNELALEKVAHQPNAAPAAQLRAVRPLVIIVDADAAVRKALRSFLVGQGYEVTTATTAREASRLMDRTVPALLIAEIEGEDLPGFNLCAHVKCTPRLESIPVVLLTRSAYPSDYANAHSLGAVVCMAKPFRMERLGHVVRLLAPPGRA